MARRRNPKYLSIDEVKSKLKKKLRENRIKTIIEEGYFKHVIDTEGIVIEESKLLEEKKDE